MPWSSIASAGRPALRHEPWFDHLPKLERVDVDGKRHYLIEGEPTRFTSVTTVIAGTRLPREQGVFKSNEAALKGTQHHKSLELFLETLGAPDALPADANPISRPVAALLDRHVQAIHGIEQRLFSKRLRAAGTADLICTWDGTPTILDHKTTRHPNNLKAAWLFPYFCQLIAYQIMVKELIDIECAIKINYAFTEIDNNGKPIHDPVVKDLPIGPDDIEAVARIFTNNQVRFHQ